MKKIRIALFIIIPITAIVLIITAVFASRTKKDDTSNKTTKNEPKVTKEKVEIGRASCRERV